MRPETIRKILSAILSFAEPCTSEQLALAVYADSKSWKRSRKIVASAAGVAGRLRAMGLLGRTAGRWFVTEHGRKYLSQEPRLAPSRTEPAQVAQRPAPGWLRWPAAPGGLLWFDGARWWWPDGQGRWWPWVSQAR